MLHRGNVGILVKNMIKYFKYLILIGFYLLLIGFKPLDFKYYFIDKPIIDKFIDSLKKIGVNEFLVLSSNLSYLDIDNSTLYKNYNLPSYSLLDTNTLNQDMTFFFWHEKGKSYFIRISNDAIYKSQKVSTSIFEYKNKETTWITEDENRLQVVSPIQEPLNKIILIYILNDKSRFFELGENIEFILNTKKQKYRENWLDLIINNIKYKTRKWEILQEYKRKE